MPRRRLLGHLFPSFLLPVSLALAASLGLARHWFEVLSLGILRDQLTAEARELSDNFVPGESGVPGPVGEATATGRGADRASAGARVRGKVCHHLAQRAGSAG